MKVSWLDYIGLVRGVNVGAGNRISMADFRAVFEGLGYTSVVTLLQSGNVVCRSARHLGTADVTAIERAFEARAGFRAGFVVLSAGQFEEVLDANPLTSVGTDLSKLVVTFLPQVPDARPAAVRSEAGAAAAPLLAAAQLPDADEIRPEAVAAGAHAIYSWHPDGISKSRIPPAFWKKLGPVYTARNVNTANKIRALIADRRSVGGSA